MFINQKSQEISLALIKLSVHARRADFRQRLERLAFQLLEDTASLNFEKALSTVSVLEALIIFGKTIYEIESINAKIVLQELANLTSAIYPATGGVEDISRVFSKVPSVAETSGAESGDSVNGKESGNGNGNGNGVNAIIRQSAIVEKIRQSGNTAMKDLVAAFPDVSERTLRYDLQRLCGQGIIDRAGNGGPASYYTLHSKIS